MEKIKNRIYNSFYKYLPVIIFIMPILGILLTVGLIMGASYFTFKSNYEKQKNILTKEFFENLKQTTKQRVELAYNLIKVIYESNEGKPNQKELTIKLMRKILDKMRWGKKGYIFVLDFHGNTIYHPDKRLMKINRWNLERHGIKVVQLLTKSALQHPQGTYVKYLAYNPTGKKPLWKVSYVKVFEPLNFFIGNGVYLNTLDENLLKQQENHKKLFDELTNKIFLITIIILSVMLLITFVVALMVKKIFQRYEKELQIEKYKLLKKATFDSLTGLYNREAFKNELKVNLENLKDGNLALIFIDLDRFKEINDTFGHDHGDKLLKEISKRLKSCVRTTDKVARFGGDEFVIQLNNVKNIEYVNDVAHRILNSIKKPINIEGHIHHLTTSIGISIAPDDTIDMEELLKNADTAMYKAKMEGKDKIEFFTKDMSKEIKERVRIKNLIYKAIENNEFVPFFQPQIDKNEKLYGAEVLTRWKKDNELIPPYKFIPIATELGLIDKIDLLVIQNAMEIYNEWIKKGYNPGVISCNITMQQIERTDFVKDIKALLEKYSFDPKNLNLEITEDSIMNNVEKSINVLKKIDKLGIKINIDDFGTGYSSLSYLKKLPVSKLKIDREFIKDIPEDKDDVAITQTIINLAKNLGLEVVAEGVENRVQKEFVIEKGCDYIQGFYYSPPIKKEEFEEKFLKDKNGS